MTESTDIKLARIEERVAGLCGKIDGLSTKMDQRWNYCDQHYVLRSEWEPVRKVVYGMVALILVAVVGGLVGLVVRG